MMAATTDAPSEALISLEFKRYKARIRLPKRNPSAVPSLPKVAKIPASKPEKE